MKRRYLISVGVAMGLAALLMIVMAPITQANAGNISAILDWTLGVGWEIFPILDRLLPYVIIWITYSVLFGLGMYYEFHVNGYHFTPSQIPNSTDEQTS